MREGWSVVALADVASHNKTKTKVMAGVEYPAVGVLRDGKGLLEKEPFVGGETTYLSLSEVHEGQLVLRTITAFEAPIAVVGPEHDGRYVSPVFPVFDLDQERLLPRFMALVCQLPSFWEAMRERTTGTVLRRKTLSASALLTIPLSLPPLAGQRRIVDLIGAVDEYVAAREAELEAGVSARAAALAKELGRGGDDWVETTVGGITKFRAGKYLKKDAYRDGGAYFVYGSNSVMGMHSEPLFDGPLIVMAGIGAYAGACRFSAEPCWVNNNAFGIFPDLDQVQPEYLYFWLDSLLDLTAVRFGTGQPYVKKGNLEAQTLLLPPLPEQQRIAELIGAFDKANEALRDELAASRTSRAALLAELLTGDFEIPATYDDLMEEAS